MSDFHGRMMNIPHQPFTTNYGLGHRDARHAAAEIANEADAEICCLQSTIAAAELRAAEMEAALANLEAANEAVCAGRSQASYDMMIADGQDGALSALDAARSRARALLPPEGDAP